MKLDDKFFGRCIYNKVNDIKIMPADLINEDNDKYEYHKSFEMNRILKVILCTIGYIAVLVLWVLFALWFHTHVSEYMVFVSPFVALLITVIYLYLIET